MRHRKKGRKFHRKRDQRKALMKNLAESLILYEEIETTLERAKELRSFVEKKITKAKKGGLPAMRYLRRFFSKEIARKLIKEIAPRFKERPGGYTKIIKLGKRKDGAEMAKIKLCQ